MNTEFWGKSLSEIGREGLRQFIDPSTGELPELPKPLEGVEFKEWVDSIVGNVSDRHGVSKDALSQPISEQQITTNMKHTPTPWVVSDNDHGFIASLSTATFVCRFFDRNEYDYPNHIANAQRIVDCVNACEGIENPSELQNSHREYLLTRSLLRDMQKERDAYVSQDKEIRTLIDADENESTYDEVARLKAKYDKLQADLAEAAKLLDECRLQVSGYTNLKIHLHLQKLQACQTPRK
jgi:hypothetical protein